ncbi:MAG: amidophosphoribosyltransferase [Ruminococcus sp.]|nr:amidophosphoribosyltransferase [Ruminococcus sp.]
MKSLILTQNDKIHEECGVFGFYKNDEELNTVDITRYALFGLQHRGQESCGMAVNDNGEFQIAKDIGMVSSVLNKKAIEKLPNGKISVGHVRYSVTDGFTRAATQPIVMRYIEGAIALANNGAITNFPEIRKELENGGAMFQSNSHAELISYVIASERIDKDSIEDAVIHAVKKLKGAYSIVLSSPSKLIGVRDGHGFRPLAIGKLNNSYMLASESCVFDSLGAELVRDVEPGEMVVIDEDGLHSYKNIVSKKSSFCIFEYVYLARPDSVINGISVYSARNKAGQLLYREHPVDADVVCGVPESGIPAAQGFSQASGIPFITGFVKNKYVGRYLTDNSSRDKREVTLMTKLTALKANVKDKRVVVIDDSIIKGETSAHIIKLMRDAGAKEVHMRISSPPFLNSCYFGTNISEDSLIANRMSVEEICKEIGADSMGYLSIDGVREIAEGATISCCDGCFSGEYKADMPKSIFVDKFAQKIKK